MLTKYTPVVPVYASGSHSFKHTPIHHDTYNTRYSLEYMYLNLFYLLPK